MPSKLENTTWYTVQEVADCLGKSYNTIDKYMKDGEIPFKKVGGVKVVKHKDLVRAMDQINLPESMIDYRLGIKSPKSKKNVKAVNA